MSQAKFFEFKIKWEVLFFTFISQKLPEKNVKQYHITRKKSPSWQIGKVLIMLYANKQHELCSEILQNFLTIKYIYLDVWLEEWKNLNVYV